MKLTTLFIALSLVCALSGCDTAGVTSGNNTACDNTDNCENDCTAQQASCQMSCSGNSTCKATCQEGQSCNFACDSKASCTFDCSKGTCQISSSSTSCQATGAFTGVCGGGSGAEVDAGAGGGCNCGSPTSAGYGACIAACQ